METNLPVGAMAASWSVTLGGMGTGVKVSISPCLNSSLPGDRVTPGYFRGSGVMRMMSGKGVVLSSTVTSPSGETRFHNSMTRLVV